MSLITRRSAIATAAAFAATPAFAEQKRDDTYSQDEIVPSIARFFGITAAAAGKAVAKVFQENGRAERLHSRLGRLRRGGRRACATARVR
ncbi:MAG: hypothetical protein WDN76_11590 [Alphaproteobacteria bacterium]